MDTSSSQQHELVVGHPLLAAKLSVPVIRTPVVGRPRLLTLVSAGVEGPLTVVSGPPGAGKTLLLVSWILTGAAPGPVAWLTLDEYDDHPGVFWAYVIAALRRAGVELPDEVGEPIRAERVDRSLLTRVANSLADRDVPLVLVLDQLDHVTHPDIRADLDFVLRNASPVLRLVLLTRHEGPLRLHRYELNGQLVHVQAAALSFTPEEADDLLRQHGVRLSGPGLASLTRHTDGWAAALRLSAVAMQRRVDPDGFVWALPEADVLTRYLVDEVLSTQAEEVREFLLRTSVVDRICPALADALTGDSDGETVLAALQTGNVLTETLEQTPSWYRYHPLFAYVLRGELRRAHPGLVEELHRRASTWFQEAGLLVESVHHAVAAGDWQLATAAVVRGLGTPALLAGREATQLDGELAGLPADEPGAMPAVVRAARALSRFDVGTGRYQLTRAEATADEEPDVARAPLLASVAVLRAVLAGLENDPAAAEAALAAGEAALAELPDQTRRKHEVLALLLASVGSVQVWSGWFAAGEQILLRGLAVSAQRGCEYSRLTILGSLAMVAFRVRRLRRAARLAQDELALADDLGLPVDYRPGTGHLTLGMVAYEWNDRAAVRRNLDDAEKTVGARHNAFLATILPLLRAWQYTSARDHRRALAALAQVPETMAGRPLPVWVARRAALTAAYIHLRRGDTAAAAAALDAVTDRNSEWQVRRAALAAATGDRAHAADLLAPVLSEELPDVAGSCVEAWVVSAQVHVEEGDPEAAREALGRALDLARPERLRRVFMEADPWLRDLLRAAPDLAAAHAWLGPPLAEATPPTGREGTGDGTPPEAPVEPLTERERAVLARMAQAMATEDIAQELFLSVNTVKTHQRHIYRKLVVSRRSEAVRKARQLGLV